LPITKYVLQIIKTLNDFLQGFALLCH
jgi:hypothetical protein